MAMPLAHRRFTVDGYYRMAEVGILGEDDRVELLDGEIVEMTPIGPGHAGCVDALVRLLYRLAGDAVILGVQRPLAVGTHWEPQPDVMLLRPRPQGYRMAEAGILGEDDRVELLDGEIIEMTPIGDRHAATVTRLHELFHELVGRRATVRVQNPVRLHAYAEPEPDVALVVRRDDRYAGGHPTPGDVLLVVEVADTSLAYDRERKLPAYAAAGIPEVWLVDLTADRIEVYRGPGGAAYGDRRVLGRNATLTVLRVPGVIVTTSEILG